MSKSVYNKPVYISNNARYICYRTYLNVTLWNDLVEGFQQEISSNKFEEPMIVIIATGKVGVFQGVFYSIFRIIFT